MMSLMKWQPQKTKQEIIRDFDNGDLSPHILRRRNKHEISKPKKIITTFLCIILCWLVLGFNSTVAETNQYAIFPLE